MIGDLAKSVIIEQTLPKMVATRPSLHYENGGKKKTKFTIGIYYIKYKPRDNFGTNRTKDKIVISCDMYPRSAKKFNSWENFLEDAKTDETTMILLQDSFIDEKHFKWALEHPYMQISFTLKYEKLFEEGRMTMDSEKEENKLRNLEEVYENNRMVKA